ncbi:MAG: tetratricopeptide repeat protein [Dehalococcoidia bacterium]
MNTQSLTKEAIALATQGRWQEAVDINTEIIQACPEDVNAYNRLGKALMELGRYAEAREAFGRALEIAPSNAIAKKNLQRVSLLMEAGPARQGAQPKITPHHFIEETGKTGVTKLVKPGPRETRARLGAGDPILLRQDGKNLIVESTTEEYIGQVEPRLAFRLLELMEGGNRYEGAITSVWEDGVSVMLREVYQDPSQADKVSFPSRSADDFRSYVKEGIFKYESGHDETPHEGDTPTWEESEDDGVPEGISIIDGERGVIKVAEEDEQESA